MAWLEVTVDCAGEASLATERALERLGAQAVTMADAKDHPVLEPGPNETPIWPHVQVTGLFDASFDPWLIRAALDHDPDVKIDEYRHRFIDDQDWTRAWMADFKPTRFGQRLWIVPSHCDPPEGADVAIELDPGLAFGTGTHPTTALCLEFLDQLDLRGKTVLDFGCGSGILAIAAIKLGAAEALCVDNDPQALEATRDNAVRNGVLDQLVLLDAASLPAAGADVVVANILARALVDLQSQLTMAAKPGAPLALSGILLDQGQPVRRAYEANFEHFEVWQRDDWLLLRADKKS